MRPIHFRTNFMRLTLIGFARSCALVTALLHIFGLSMGTPRLQAQSGFGEIRIGAPPSTVPFDCTGLFSNLNCEGVYQSSWVRARSAE
jgi:hypothetical protein